MNSELKEHWENIYRTKQPHEVSWTQERPSVSLEFIHFLSLPKDAAILDIGGGDSKLADHLLNEGYSNITVLDISEVAIERAKKRLGADASRVKWLVSDVLDFQPAIKYTLWHDRAAFHFQTDPGNIHRYLTILRQSGASYVIIGTFSTSGPEKCSGLEIKQYDETTMQYLFGKFGYEATGCKREDHVTPSGAVQNFQFCSFRKA